MQGFMTLESRSADMRCSMLTGLLLWLLVHFGYSSFLLCLQELCHGSNEVTLPSGLSETISLHSEG